MTSSENAGEGHGTIGVPQTDIEELEYEQYMDEILAETGNTSSPLYAPSPKHNPGSNWGSENPIQSDAEGQSLLSSGIKNGKQIYNVTSDGRVVKFQPDNSPNNGYHSYEVSSPRDIPSAVLKAFRDCGLISKADYNKLRKGKV